MTQEDIETIEAYRKHLYELKDMDRYDPASKRGDLMSEFAIFRREFNRKVAEINAKYESKKENDMSCMKKMSELTGKELFIEQARQMLEMQRNLDEKIFKEFGLYGYADSRLDYGSAILDEVGELNHELKPDWCWWKKNVGKVNRERVLEELVDIVHFMLSYAIYLFENAEVWDRIRIEPLERFSEGYDSWLEVKDCNKWYVDELLRRLDGYPGCYFFELVHKLGFTWTDVYEAYMKKNAVNLERLENGY